MKRSYVFYLGFGWWLSDLDWFKKYGELSNDYEDVKRVLEHERRARTAMNATAETYIDRNTEPYLESADLRNKLATAEKEKAASDAQVLKLEREMAKLVRSNAALRGRNTRLKAGR